MEILTTSQPVLQTPEVPVESVITPVENAQFDQIVATLIPEVSSDIASEQVEVQGIEATRGRRFLRKLGQVAKGEAVGTALDVVSIAAGVPIPVQEVVGSTLDYKIYNSSAEDPTNPNRPSRVKRLGRAAGTVALYATTGMIAQKYGSDFVEMLGEGLKDGVAGDFVAPLGSKLGAMTGVNLALSKLAR